MGEAALLMSGVANQESGCQASPAAEDAALVEAFQGGDKAAFEGLFLKYQGCVFSLCVGVWGHEEDARDATQETFLRAYQGLRRFRGEAAFSTWLYRIALHAAQQLHRRRRQQRTWPLAALRGQPDLPPDLLDRCLTQIVRCERIRAVLGELSVGHQTALVLRYYRDLSYEEMAEVLEVSVAAVKARLHRARQSFYQVYRRMFGEEEM